MIGKLQVWKGEHRSTKDFSRQAGVGGFVSIEDLGKKPQSQSPVRSPKKKVPFLSLGRHSLLPKSQHEDGNAVGLSPPMGANLFSNVTASAGLPPDSSRPSSPLRPQTADPDPAAFANRRSKIAPADTPFQLTLDFTDKPLPLSLDFDHARKRSSSNHSARLLAQEHATAGASIPRPRTSQSIESKASGPRGRKRSGSQSKGSSATYSLTPAITPTQSRRPSLAGMASRNASQTDLLKTLSMESAQTPARQRARSNASAQVPPPERPAPVPSPARSVLSEVEGTLSATIRELQDLQGSWDENGGLRPTPSIEQNMFKVPSAPDVPQSARAHQAHFMQRAHSDPRPSDLARQLQVQVSMPTTPMPATVSSLPKAETPSLGRMQSIQIAYEKSKAKLRKSELENDTLRQQLNFTRERLGEMEELRSDKDTLEAALKEANANIENALQQLAASRATEQATQNNLANLQRRLEEANMQRVDVLEVVNELRENIGFMESEMEETRKEVNELKMRPEASELELAQAKVGELEAQLLKAEDEKKLLAEQAEQAQGRADLPAVVADLTFKLEDVKRTVTEKDKYIEELELQNQDLSKEMEQLREDRARLSKTTEDLKAEKSKVKRLSQLEKQIIEVEKARAAAQNESNRYNALLQEQIRRNTQGKAHPASSLLEQKVNIEDEVNAVRLKAAKRLAEAKGESAALDEEEQDEEGDLEKENQRLKAEVEYHVKDIVLYKLDVKGYKKDLKRANAKIAALTESINLLTSNSTARPSISSQSSTTSVPQAVPTPVASPSEEKEVFVKEVAKAVPVGISLPVGHIVSVYAGASPRASPMRERKAFVGAS